MTVADLVYIDTTGFHYADFPSFLTYVQGIFQGIYGSDIYLGADSQDGQLVAAFAQALFDSATVGAANYNSFSPATAKGVGLARVVKINGLRKLVPSNSTVELTIVGQAFTTITNGIAQDSLSQQWLLPATVVIPSGGSITVTATAQNAGAVQALANTITTIFTPTQGWQTVNNAAAATVGAPVESDAALRARQAVSTANPSLTVLEGSTGAIENVAGVTQVQPYDNSTASTDANGIPAHMVSFVVEGGTDTDVANAIALHKTPGVGTYGSTSVPTLDKNGVPITINFYRPTVATIGVKITLRALTSWITSNETIIADAVSAFIQAIKIGGQNLGAGSFGVSFSQLFGVAYVPGSVASGSFIIESIQLKKNGGAYSAADVALLFNEIATCDPVADVSFILL